MVSRKCVGNSERVRGLQAPSSKCGSKSGLQYSSKCGKQILGLPHTIRSAAPIIATHTRAHARSRDSDSDMSHVFPIRKQIVSTL